jgi:hypothetical protein
MGKIKTTEVTIHLTSDDVQEAITSWAQRQGIMPSNLDSRSLSLEGDFHCLSNNIIAKVKIPQ